MTWWMIALALGLPFLVWLALELKTSRPDGTLLKVHPLRRMMFYIMPTRTESVAYFDVYADATKLQEYLPLAREKFGANFTHAVVAAGEYGLGCNLNVNRFVAGKRMYQRKGRYITFSMKRKVLGQRSTDKARLATVKLRTDGIGSFRDLCEQVNEKITVNRSGKKTSADKEIGLFDLLPRPLLALGASLIQKADYYNMLPAFFIEDDPLYTSMFIANLGSLDMDTGYHHLFEYGTCHAFVMVGRVHRHPVEVDGETVWRPRIHMRFTYDERMDDGLAARHGFTAMCRVLEDPFRWLGCLEDDGSDARPIGPSPDWVSEDGVFALRD